MPTNEMVYVDAEHKFGKTVLYAKFTEEESDSLAYRSVEDLEEETNPLKSAELQEAFYNGCLIRFMGVGSESADEMTSAPVQLIKVTGDIDVFALRIVLSDSGEDRFADILPVELLDE